MRSCLFAMLCALLVCRVASVCAGQDLDVAAEMQRLRQRLDSQSAEIESLRLRLDNQPSEHGAGAFVASDGCGSDLRRLPVVVEHPLETDCTGATSPDEVTLRYYTDYDKGFVLRPFDRARSPFELKLNGWSQIRHHAFARDVATWTDNANVVRNVRNRNAFDVERARLQLSGTALDPRLSFFIQLDGDTDGSHLVDFFDYWWAWEAHEWLKFFIGKRKVPGSRQWILGARHTRFVDRPMANDFFRPDRTIGLFANGSFGKAIHYEVMLGNGYRTSNLPNSATDNLFTFAATNYIDPWGDFGGTLVDFEYHCDPLLRVGHSFVYSPQSASNSGAPLDETDFVRLADGTMLTQIGALAPGVTVSEFDIVLYSIDLAMKWRGWSFNAEAFFRWIDQIGGDGALPTSSIYQHGFYVEGGCFLIEKKLDVNLRYSEVRDPYATATEAAAGLNWHPMDSQRLKISFDVTLLDGSPLHNTTSDILVGDDGLLFRTQFQVEF